MTFALGQSIHARKGISEHRNLLEWLREAIIFHSGLPNPLSENQAQKCTGLF